MMWTLELIIWIGLLVLTLYRRQVGKLTVSQWVEKQLPRAVDVAIVIAIAALVWSKCGEVAGLTAIRYMMIGHILLGHETYESLSWQKLKLKLQLLWQKVTGG